LIAYLSEQRLFFTVNHVFSSVTDGATKMTSNGLRGTFPGIEGAMARCFQRQTGMPPYLPRRKRKVQVAGSDAHALASVGTTV